MLGKEMWWVWGGNAILLVLFFNHSGFAILQHTLWLGIFLFLVGGALFLFLNLFTYSSSKEKLNADKSQSKKVNDKTTHPKTTVNRNDCAELLTSKGYELYRGLNMIYSVGPIGGYGVDAVFKSKSLNEIYEFSIQVEDLNVSVKEED